MKKFIFTVIYLVVIVTSLSYAEVSSYLLQWQVGDTWQINVYQRDSSELSAAMEIPVRRFGEFFRPIKYKFKVIDKKIVDGQECFVIETWLLGNERVLIYYTVNELNLVMIELFNTKENRKLDYFKMHGQKILFDTPTMCQELPLSWPDFNNLDVGSSPQTIELNDDYSIIQNVKEKDGNLFVTWEWKNKVNENILIRNFIWEKGSKWWGTYWTEGLDGFDRNWKRAGEWNILAKAELISDITALINIEPDTLNLKSQGKYITCYIELPKEYRPEDIDINAILLNDVVACEPSPTSYPDSDKNGIRELMVKFDRAEVIALLSGETEEVLTVTSRLKNGQSFKGEEKIKVVEKKPRLKGWIRSCQWSDKGKGIVCIDISFEPKGKEKIKNIVVKEIEMSKGVSFDPKLSPALPYEIGEMSPMYVISQKPSFKIEPGIKKIGFVVKGTCQDENGRIFDFKFGKRFRIEKIKDFQEDIITE